MKPPRIEIPNAPRIEIPSASRIEIPYAKEAEKPRTDYTGCGQIMQRNKEPNFP